jgi:hypothetical protein
MHGSSRDGLARCSCGFNMAVKPFGDTTFHTLCKYSDHGADPRRQVQHIHRTIRSGALEASLGANRAL